VKKQRAAEMTISLKRMPWICYLVYCLGTVFFLYPFLHELGHAIFAWLFGGKVVQITIYPSCYTECFIRPGQTLCYIMAAMAGILFPLLCSLMVSTRRVEGFLVALSIRIMSLAYSVGELVSVSRCIMGSATETSDLGVLVYTLSIDPYIPLILAGFLMILSLLLLVAMDPTPLVVHLSSGKGDRVSHGHASRYGSY
jgi:hypothetical protein